MTFQARTAYNVPIPLSLSTKSQALNACAYLAKTFPGSRIVQLTARGTRTIWKHEPEKPSAPVDCDMCGEPRCTREHWSEVAGLYICDTCMEASIEASVNTGGKVEMVGRGHSRP